ncbi:MAG: hypothetical protein AMXMBFR81_08960 [Chthonomonas sp.]
MRPDTTTFAYSDPMFLTAVDGPSGRLATYVYDSESKRRRIYEGSAFTTLVWDGWDYLQWRRPSGTHVFHTMNGEIVGESVGGVVRDYLLDPLGSVVATLDAAGLVDQFEYWPYGELVDDLPEGAPVFLWVGGLGYWFDTDERRYVRHRMLRADLGSWMQLDPLWNRAPAFQYCSQTPAQVSDPTGLRAVIEDGKAECDAGAVDQLYWAQRLLCSEMFTGPASKCIQGCAKEAGVSMDCLARFCHRGKVQLINCPLDDSMQCPSCCSRTHTLTTSTCGSTPCATPLLFRFCCNSLSKYDGSRCGCPSILTMPPNPCDDVFDTFYHELGHVCGQDCNHHIHNDERDAANRFAACVKKCLRVSFP